MKIVCYEDAGRPAGAGRSTQVLRFSGGVGRVCGIDLGASNSRFILTDFRATLTAAWTEATPKVRDAEQLADWIAHRVRAAHGDGGSPVVTAIGLPGAVVPEEGQVLHAPPARGRGVTRQLISGRETEFGGTDTIANRR